MMTVEEHMIHTTCKGIVQLLKGPHDFTEKDVNEYRTYYGVDVGSPNPCRYTENEIDEYMNTYIADLKKYDKDLAHKIENAYILHDLDTVISNCAKIISLHQ